MIETIEENVPDIYWGAWEGGHAASVTSWNDIGAQAALVLVEKESKLTGWEFKKNGVRNSRGQFVWILVRADKTILSEGPDWRTLTKGVENVQK